MNKIITTLFILLLVPSIMFCHNQVDSLASPSDPKKGERILLIKWENAKDRFLGTHITQYLNDYLIKEKEDYEYIIESDNLEKQEIISVDLKKNYMSGGKTGSVDFDEEYKINVEQSAAKFKNIKNVMTIDISQLNELVEYQIRLYKTTKSGSPDETTDTSKTKLHSIKLQETKAVNFLIDPKSDTYKEIINFELRKLFEDSNETPIATIRLNHQLINNDINYVAKGDTIIIDALSSTDIETPFNLLKFRWSLDIEANAQYIVGFNINSTTQKIVITKGGLYTFKLIVFDGIEYSKKEVVKIEIIERPEVSINSKVNRLFYQSSIIKDIIGNKEKELKNKNAKLFFDKSDFDSLTLELIRDNQDMMIQSDYAYNREAVPKIVISFSKTDYQSKCNDSIYDDSTKRNTTSTTYVKYTPTLCVKNIIEERKQINLEFNSFPGRYKYIFYGEKHNVKSNIDTLVFEQTSYRPFYILFGYQVFRITNDANYLDASISQNFELGFRVYLVKRLSLDFNLLIPISNKNQSKSITEQIYPNNIKLDLNYDFISWPQESFYLTGFGSVYQFVFPDNDTLDGIRQFGIGAKLRSGILRKKTNWGAFFIEASFGYYFSPSRNDPYESIAYNLSLVYGFYK